MISIILYGISILFTPGPITLLSINLGIQRKFKDSYGYYFGVGLATFILFLIYGYTGQQLIKKEYLFYISILGGLYILYLSYKMFKTNIQLDLESENHNAIGFREGFLMQFINPKASLAALPIATISFPANDITGINILFISLIFFIMGILSPLLYCFMAQYFSRFLKNEWINYFNKGMAVIMLYVGISIMTLFH